MTKDQPKAVHGPSIKDVLDEGIVLTWPSQLTALKASHKNDWLTLERDKGWGLQPISKTTYKLTHEGISDALAEGRRIDQESQHKNRQTSAHARLGLIIFFIAAPFGSMLMLDADGALKWKSILTCGFIALIALAAFSDFRRKTKLAFLLNLIGLLGTAGVQIWDITETTG